MKKEIDRIKEIVKDSNDSKECCEKLADEKLIVSFGEGRRLWHSLKERNKNE